MKRFVIISGCSGGGKSTLLAELAHRGCATVEEPGRRIVQQELCCGGHALPWVDAAAFARRAVAVALADRAAARRHKGWVFFDRGLIDAAAGLQHATGEPALTTTAHLRDFHRRVFMCPPWPEIYAADAERRHGFAAALAEYRRLARVYPTLGYAVTTLPRTEVAARADLVLAILARAPPKDA